MHVLYGKQIHTLDAPTLLARYAPYHAILVDLGTGDGRYVRSVACARPDLFVIGLDACRENLRDTSRTAPANALFVVANALALPRELAGLAGHITINFPWGSLLAGLVDGDPALLSGLRMLAHTGARLEVRLNAGALVEAGWSLEQGAAAVRRSLRACGFDLGPAESLGAAALRACPTSWAKRLAFGRDPRALCLRAALPDGRQPRLREDVGLGSGEP